MGLMSFDNFKKIYISQEVYEEVVVKGLKLDNDKIESIIQIQEKLHVTYGRNRKKAAIGVYPLEKIKFPVIYKADLPEKIKFQPLEVDYEMTAQQILENH